MQNSLAKLRLYLCLAVMLCLPGCPGCVKVKSDQHPDVIAWRAEGQKLLPPGEGREQTLNQCTKCHSVDRFIQLRLSSQDWDVQLDRMNELLRAQNQPEYKKAPILKYLLQNYGVE